MKFGYLTQIQAPRPWSENVDYKVHWEALEQGVRAEAAGFEYFWITEHHFFEEIGHSSAPEILLTALAGRTTKLRIGHGVVVIPCNNPIRIAERAATLDIFSNGRVELGTGRGASPYHIEAFGVSPEESKEVWAEGMEVLSSLFRNDFFPGHKGKYFDFPARMLVPKPVQKPHPPLWVAAASPETFAMAAKKGLGILGFAAMAPEALLPAIARYREVADQADPAEYYGAYANHQIAAVANAYCDTDNARGREIGGAAARWFLGDNDAPLNSARFGQGAFFKDEKPHAGQKGFSNDELVESGKLIAGDPDSCCRVIERWAKTGVDQLMLLIQTGNVTHDQVLRSIDLFGEKVFPKFT